jgi:hypothetical protein
VVDNFLVWSSKPCGLRFDGFLEVDAGHTTRSSGLLRMEVSLVRVFQSGLKTGGDAMTDGARGTIAEVMSKSS